MKLTHLFEDSVQLQGAIEELRQTLITTSKMALQKNFTALGMDSWLRPKKGDHPGLGVVAYRTQKLSDAVAQIGLKARNVLRLLQEGRLPERLPLLEELGQLTALLLEAEALPDYFSTSLEGEPEGEPEKEEPKKTYFQNITREIDGYYLGEAYKKLLEQWNLLVTNKVWADQLDALFTPLEPNGPILGENALNDQQALGQGAKQVFSAAQNIAAHLETLRELAGRIILTMGKDPKVTQEQVVQATRKPEHQRPAGTAPVPAAPGGEQRVAAPAQQVQTPALRTNKLADELASAGVGGDTFYRRQAVQQALSANPDASDDEVISTAVQLHKEKAVKAKHEEPWRTSLRRRLKLA